MKTSKLGNKICGATYTFMRNTHLWGKYHSRFRFIWFFLVVFNQFGVMFCFKILMVKIQWLHLTKCQFLKFWTRESIQICDKLGMQARECLLELMSFTHCSSCTVGETIRDFLWYGSNLLIHLVCSVCPYFCDRVFCLCCDPLHLNIIYHDWFKKQIVIWK